MNTPYKTHTLRLTLSPDGSALAAATENDMDGSREVCVWNITRQTGTLSSYSGEVPQTKGERRVDPTPIELTVSTEAFTFDGRYVAVGGAGRNVILFWDTHEPFSPPPTRRPARRSGTEWDEQVWDEPTPEELPRRTGKELTIDFEPRALALAPGGLLAYGGAGLAVWRNTVSEWTELACDSQVTALAFSPCATRLVVGTQDGSVAL